jgi:hypothetical protein
MALIPKENLIKASNLLFISAGISLVTLIVFLVLPVAVSIISSVVSISLVLVLAFFVRAGFEWARYLFALIVILNAIGAPFMASVLAGYPLLLAVYTIQVIIHVYAAVLMFRKRESEYNS